MNLTIINSDENLKVVLLNDEMKIIKPVYNYLKFLKLKGRADNTLKAYGTDLKLYWDFLQFNNLDYKMVSPKNISEFIEYLREPSHDKDIGHVNVESARVGTTINRILNTVDNFYKYCALIEKINNPIFMEEIERPRNMFKSLLHHARKNNKTNRSIFKVKETKHKVKLLTEDEIKIIFDNLNTWRDKLIFKILYLSGARIQEVLDLKIEDIPRITPSIQEKGVVVLDDIKSKGKLRDLYLPVSLVSEIEDFIMEKRLDIDTKHSYIFVAQQKRYLGNHLTYSAIYGVFLRVKEKLGVKFKFHDLRHTRITGMIESGLDIAVVKILAGHKHISTTQNYTHLSDNFLKSEIKKYWEKSSLFTCDNQC
ncbi:MAG: phage integrase family protein [Halanaerobium sp. T82-1]|nr:MAG: phage integrase family protein [Halanaerobium sp. T82-1]